MFFHFPSAQEMNPSGSFTEQEHPGRIFHYCKKPRIRKSFLPKNRNPRFAPLQKNTKYQKITKQHPIFHPKSQSWVFFYVFLTESARQKRNDVNFSAPSQLCAKRIFYFLISHYFFSFAQPPYTGLVRAYIQPEPNQTIVEGCSSGSEYLEVLHQY